MFSAGLFTPAADGSQGHVSPTHAGRLEDLPLCRMAPSLPLDPDAKEWQASSAGNSYYCWRRGARFGYDLNTRPIAGESATAAEAGCQEQYENQLHSKVGPEGFRRLCQQPSRQGRALVRAPTATSPSSTLPGMACRKPGRPSGFAPASILTAGLMSQK